MRQIKHTTSVVTVTLLLTFAADTSAEQARAYRVNVEELAAAIEAWSGPARWWECGHPYTKIQAHSRSLEYAEALVKAGKREGHSPLVMAAMIEQESGYDECAIGRPVRRRFGLPNHPTRARVLSTFDTPHGRRRLGRGVIDAGPAQFLWPSREAQSMTKGVPLASVLSVEWSVPALARILTYYRIFARQRWGRFYIFEWGGREKRVSTGSAYFVHHNRAYPNPRYYRNVRGRGMRLWRHIEKQRSGDT